MTTTTPPAPTGDEPGLGTVPPTVKAASVGSHQSSATTDSPAPAEESDRSWLDECLDTSRRVLDATDPGDPADDDVNAYDEDDAYDDCGTYDEDDADEEDDGYDDCDLLDDDCLDGTDRLGAGDIPPPGAHLPDDTSLVEYMRSLVGPVSGRAQLWITVLDAEDCMTPVLVVMERISPTPDRHGTVLTVGRALLEALTLTREPRLVVAVVRRGGGSPAPMEARWAGAVREAAADLGVPLRAVMSVGPQRAVLLTEL